MDVPTLIVLGAAGGLLRGALDVYTRFIDWQADRRLHRQSMAAGAATEGELPRFQGYFDPIADPVAAVVHSLMGAGAAVLFGTTGQISGAYAALVVGISAPMLLTQLGRIQSVNEAVTGERQPAEPTEPAGVVGAGGTVGTAGAVAPGPVLGQPSAVPRIERPARGTELQAFGLAADAHPREPAPGRYPEPGGDVVGPSRSAHPPDAAGTGLDGPGAPRWRQGPAIGEEGMP
ncbi:hypothetical protein ABZ725_18500 [Streptomyces sp. NPDC006872]|uniref:hypothetical protein n=1 Tax=Streptomyces sp. NPDC006872 TaxID=3155720 RepID=UPI0033F7CB71